MPVEELQPYIQDALDLIEFANGGTNTKWGALRAEMGHPAPFNMKFIGIGNEQWDQLYPDHLAPFVDALRKAHPEIKIVGSSGPDSEGKQFDYLWPEMKRLGADLVDEHFYRPYNWFLSQGSRYDNYDRKGPKVFAGEYAAFMTGLERNADIVHMATYAPLFAHVEGWQWRPDLIWYDNLRSMRTVSWHVQQLYGRYKGENVLKLTMDGRPVAGAEGQNGLFASAVKDGDKVYVKVANTSEKSQPVCLNFTGLKKKDPGLKAVRRIVLKSDELYKDNTLDEPCAIVPAEAVFTGAGKTLEADVPALSFTIFILER